MEKQNLAVKYEYRGYRLMKAEINRVKDGPLKGFTLFSKKNIFDPKQNIYELITEITITFGDEVSSFAFSAGFKIIDLEWLEIMAEETVVNELFNIAFPYIREKVSEFTGDFRPGFIMPVLNPKQFDFTKKINFNFELKKPEAKKEDNNPNLVN